MAKISKDIYILIIASSISEITAFYDIDAEVWLASDKAPWSVEDIEVAENPML
jgi:hypothetical protein